MLSENGLKEPPGVAFRRLTEKATSLGITPAQLAELHSAQKLRYKPKPEGTVRRFLYYWTKKLPWILPSVLVALFAVMMATQWPMTRRQVAEYFYDYVLDIDIERDACALEVPDEMIDLVRPPADCSVCTNMTAVDRVAGISPNIFEERYAYSGVPVVITDGTSNWTAPEVFSFKFFKSIYKDNSPALDSSESNCQFFPYKTDFHSLRDVFNMSDERAELKDGTKPWYIGWSNCDSSAANILRKHYRRPYFLPSESESSKTDWIFMGSPGYGAHMHIDNVGNPSWQAQITGTKEWTLEPPAECYHVCPNQIKVVVHPGEIIVLDTNLWYHGTLITGDDLSIVIGSEYD